MKATEDNPLPIHIGLHKTGSTFLQRNVFPLFFPDMPKIDVYGAKSSPAIIDKFWKGDVSNILVISDEGLSGRLQPSYPGEGWDRFLSFYERIRTLSRRPLILLVIREHREWLRSAYLEKLKNCAESGRSFDEYVNLFSENDLSWHARIEVLQEFPLLLLLHEDLRKHPLETTQMIADFWGCQLPNKWEKKVAFPNGLTNQTPKTYFALNVLRYEAMIRKLIKRIVSKFSSRKVTLSCWKNKGMRNWIASFLNNYMIGTELNEYQFPESLVGFLDKDWKRAKSMATRPSIISAK